MYSGTVLPLKEYFRGRRVTEYGIRQDNQMSLELGIIRAYKNAIEDILIIGRDSTLDKTRKKNIVEARFIIWYLIRKDFSGITLKKIGEYFSKDHATIIHGIETVRDLLHVKDPMFIKKFVYCSNEVYTFIQHNTTSI